MVHNVTKSWTWLKWLSSSSDIPLCICAITSLSEWPLLICDPWTSKCFNEWVGFPVGALHDMMTWLPPLPSISQSPEKTITGWEESSLFFGARLSCNLLAFILTSSIKNWVSDQLLPNHSAKTTQSPTKEQQVSFSQAPGIPGFL